MIEKLPTLLQLVRHLQQIPYLASKNIYKVTDYLLSLDPQRVEQLCQSILDAKNNIHLCSLCCTWKEKTSNCIFCSEKRDQSIICVVETWQELMSIEKTKGYQGTYHVLGGAINPLNGIDPEHLTINNLLKRITPDLKEIILATNHTPEGEATATYIANKLKHSHVIITCLARGIPVGSSLEFIDKLTVYKALSDRRPF